MPVSLKAVYIGYFNDSSWETLAKCSSVFTRLDFSFSFISIFVVHHLLASFYVSRFSEVYKLPKLSLFVFVRTF